MYASALSTRILIIDDDPVLCELLTQLLRNEGFDVLTRLSGSDALALLAAECGSFDAILTDLQMGEMGGLELAPRVREMACGAILVGMSARTPSTKELAAFDAFLIKPFSVPDLRLALEEAYLGHAAGVHAPPSRSEEGMRTTESAGPRHPLPERGRPSTANAAVLPAVFTGLHERPAVTPDSILDQRIFGQLRAAVGATQLSQLYEMTAQDVDSRLLRMYASLQEGDPDAVRKEAHAIKGSCAMVGAVELSRLAAEIEAGSETDSTQLAAMQEACIRLRQVVTIVPP